MSASSVDLADAASGPPPSPRDPSQQRPPWRSALTRFDIKATPYLMVSPFYLLFAVFGMFPLLYNGVVSLRHWQLDNPDADGWTGFSNYEQLWHDPTFWKTLRTTFGLFICSSVPQMLIALFLAAVLNRKLRGQTFFRMGVLLPYVTPIAASSIIFNQVFTKDIGVVDNVLSWMHLPQVDWRADVWSSWTAISIQVDWRWTGYWTVIFLAAMQSVSKDLYEAATVDGAGPWRQFWKITVPLIRPAIVFAMVMTTIGGLQLFTEPLLFDANVSQALGGSDGQFQTIVLYIYKTAWLDLDLGYAAALCWALFLIIVVLSALNALWSNRIGGRR